MIWKASGRVPSYMDCPLLDWLKLLCLCLGDGIMPDGGRVLKDSVQCVQSTELPLQWIGTCNAFFDNRNEWAWLYDQKSLLKCIALLFPIVTSTVIHPITCSIILLRLAQASVFLPLSSSKSINNYRHIVYTYILCIKSWDCCVQIEQSDLKTNPFQCWINTSELSNFNVKCLIKKPLSVLDTMPVLTSDHIKDLIEKVVWLSNPLRNTSR